MHNDKFNKDLIAFFNENFNKKEHLFIFCCGGYQEDKFLIPKAGNVIIINIANRNLKEVKFLLMTLEKAKKIILHGLFIRGVFEFLDKNKYLLKKCAWVIWGGDLYHYKYRQINKEENEFEEVRKRVLGKIDEFITGTKGDFELAKEIYNKNAKWKFSFSYLSNIIIKNYKVDFEKLKNKEKFNVLLGNSASSANNHLETIEKLKKYQEKINKLICPLSYCGTKDYIEEVVKKGQEVFGERFIPLTDYLKREEYDKMLENEIDVAIFNHERQQAFGNITQLLAMGKTVYINQKSTLTDVCQNLLKIKIFFVKGLLKNFSVLNEKEMKNNIELMQKGVLSLNNFKKSWEDIFYE